MTQKDKDLLLKDLCARLPYGVKVQVYLQSDTYSPIVCKVCSIECAEIGSAFIGVETSPDTYNEFREFLCKPYLFPLSSMTEEQKEEYAELQQRVIYNGQGLVNLDVMKYVDWCYKHHIDIHGLIPMGLAIDATGLNIY